MANSETLAEEYTKVKHQRDQVVTAFNKLKERQRDLEAELAELRAAAEVVVEECYESHHVTTKAVVLLNGLV